MFSPSVQSRTRSIPPFFSLATNPHAVLDGLHVAAQVGEDRVDRVGIRHDVVDGFNLHVAA